MKRAFIVPRSQEWFPASWNLPPIVPRFIRKVELRQVAGLVLVLKLLGSPPLGLDGSTGTVHRCVSCGS